MFYFDANNPPRKELLLLAKNALRKLRTVRHPDVLKFIDAVETDTTVYIMTERVKPLGNALQNVPFKVAKEKEDWLVWGLHRLSVSALALILCRLLKLCSTDSPRLCKRLVYIDARLHTDRLCLFITLGGMETWRFRGPQ